MERNRKLNKSTVTWELGFLKEGLSHREYTAYQYVNDAGAIGYPY